MRRRSSNKEIEEFSKVYDKYADDLFKHAYFRVSNREVALDLVQDCFTKTWNQVVKKEKIINYKFFLYKVLRNLIIDYYRKKKSVSLDSIIDDGFEPNPISEDRIIDSAERENLIKLLQVLPDQYKDVMILRYIDGLSIKQISEIIEESDNVVSVRIHRGTNKLKEHLDI